MTSDDKNSDTVKVKSLAKDISDQAMTTVRAASIAMEAEAELLRKLEDTHREVNETIVETRHAIKAEAIARIELSQARNNAKQILIKVKKATRNEVKAEKGSKIRSNKLKSELEKVRKAEEQGKLPGVAARDRAMHIATEAEHKAKLAYSEGDKARELLLVANVEVKAAQERLRLASAWIHTSKGKKAAAKGKVAHIEDDAEKAILEAQKALKIQASAKKGMDRTIRGLRTVMNNESRLAQAAEEAQAQTELSTQEVENKARTTADLLFKRFKALAHPEVKLVKVMQAATDKTRRRPKNATEIRNAINSDIDRIVSEFIASNPKSELIIGMVRLLVVGPTDLTRLAIIHERLERDHDCRVKSIGGGSLGEGTGIIIQADQPITLLPRLRELEFVEWVSRKGKDIEVTLKPFTDASVRPVENTSAVLVTDPKEVITPDELF